MSKLFKIEKLTLGELKTIKSYIEWLESERGIKTTRQAIHYQLEKTENLDWCEWNGLRFIVFNNKARIFSPKESKKG